MGTWDSLATGSRIHRRELRHSQATTANHDEADNNTIYERYGAAQSNGQR